MGTPGSDDIAAIDLEVLALLQRRAAATTPSGAGTLDAKQLRSIWREIDSACNALVAPLEVAYLGPRGTFSELAAFALFGSSLHGLPCASIDEVFRATSTGTASVGVAPIENSTEGMVARSLDLLRIHPALSIIGETNLLIEHAFLRLQPGVAGIKAVCAHPQALAQCHTWLHQNVPSAELRPVASNAEGARLATTDTTIAGIASKHAAHEMGLHVVATAIQDEPNNRTRFVVLTDSSRHPAPAPSANDRTSLIVSVPNQPGAVHDLLVPLKRYGVSMSKLESRPARAAEEWAYYFYIDIDGHSATEPVRSALAELRALCTFWRFLGSYPVSAG